jgi:hypothetical protein
MDVTTLALGSRLKHGHGKVRAENATRESHLHFQSARECEGMNPHAPKWIPTLGVRVLMESQIFFK